MDFGNLNVIDTHSCLAGDSVKGMCTHSGRLYTVENRTEQTDIILAVYSVTKQNNLTLLDTLELGEYARAPRVDQKSGRVFVPCSRKIVCAVMCDGSKLGVVCTLTCVKDPGYLAVLSSNTLYVSDCTNVCQVDVAQDRIIDTLRTWNEIWYSFPKCLAILGDTILVEYTDPGDEACFTLALFRHNVSSRGTVIPPGSWQWQCKYLYGLTTDNHSHFLALCEFGVEDPNFDRGTVYVFGLDLTGDLAKSHKAIHRDGTSRVTDCALLDRTLWVGFDDGSLQCHHAETRST